MFTGLIETTGAITALAIQDTAAQLTVRAGFAGEVALGDSIAVNGCCLTVVARTADTMTFDLLRETLDRTSLRDAQPGDLVNLERALAAHARLGGHFVQGHVDTASEILRAGAARRRSPTGDRPAAGVCAICRLQRFHRHRWHQPHRRRSARRQLHRLAHPAHRRRDEPAPAPRRRPGEPGVRPAGEIRRAPSRSARLCHSVGPDRANLARRPSHQKRFRLEAPLLALEK